MRGIGYDENSWATPSGPGVLFNEDFPDGILDEEGVVLPEAQEAIKFWMAFFTLIRVAHKAKAEIIVEQPVSRGRNSLFAFKGKEWHTTMFNTSMGVKAIESMQLEGGPVRPRGSADQRSDAKDDVVLVHAGSVQNRDEARISDR